MTVLSVAAVALIAAVLVMSAAFVVARRIGRYDIVDVAWGLTFIGVSLATLAVTSPTATAPLVVCLVCVWGIRLSRHIYRRFRAASQEDARYAELRNKWGSSNQAIAVYTRIYLVQAILAVIVCAPVVLIQAVGVEAQPVCVVIGLAVWMTGFIFETVGDRQLREFIQNPAHKGRLMTAGLWKYSRHPNYFGELMQWWGIGVIALGVPYGWVGLIGPIMITYLIVFVSGVPPVERAFEGRQGWAEYKARTSVLIPWPVRRHTEQVNK